MHNQGQPLQNVWVGLYTELASGFRDDYSCWPPASMCGIYGSWFRKAWVQYDGADRLFREHYCLTQPVPANCDLAHVPAWAGVRLLGVTPGSLADPGKHVTLAAWNFSPGNTARDQDVERYALDERGHRPGPVRARTSSPSPGTRSNCSPSAPSPRSPPATASPWTSRWWAARRSPTSSSTRAPPNCSTTANFDITVPVEVSLVSAEAEPGLARLRWSVASGADTRWTVARRREDAPWQGIAEATADGSGDVRFEDRDVAAGERYGYRLESPAGATFGEAWVEVPRETGFALLGARPNPAGPRGLEVFFSLAEAGPVSVEVFDPAGRRVLARDLGTLEPGSHQVSLERPAALRPGACFIRLRQGGRSRTQRAVVLE